MTTMINPSSTNGRRRPSLGEQINRLDNMLDGLSDGLNEAVADAVKVGVGTAVKEAVQAVLTEVLTNPEMRARLFPMPIPIGKLAAEAATPSAANPAVQCRHGWWQRVRACINVMRAACAGVVQAAGNSISHVWQSTCDHFAAAWASCGVLWPFKFQILFALLIGISVGMGVCHAEPWIAAVTSGFGGFVTTLTVQAGLWLRRTMANDSREIA